MKMKKTLLGIVFICLLASSAWAAPVYENLDNFISPGINRADLEAYGNGSSPATEYAWAQALIRSTPELTGYGSYVINPVNVTRYDTPEDSGLWVQIGNTDNWAIHFESYQPTFFFIKTGNLDHGQRTVGANGSEQYHFLFQNLDNKDYGVIDLSDLGLCNIGQISHIAEIDPSQVPIPATLLLFGSGLLGLLGFKKRQ
jgi:hypothetical protein